MILKSIFWMTVLIWVAFPFKAIAQKTEAEIREAVSNLVHQRHPKIPEGFWESLGESASGILKKIFLESKSAQERSFLIDGLSHFKDTDTALFLQAEISRSKGDIERKKLLGALVQSQGEKSFEFVEPYLNDPSPHVRKQVALQLDRISENPKIKKRMDDYRKSEKATWITKDLDQLKAGKSSRQNLKTSGKPVSNSKIGPEVHRLTPLPEKEWAGLWRGSLVSESKIQMVDVKLQSNAKAPPFQWKAELTLPNRSKKEWLSEEITVQTFVTDQAYWIEVRHSKTDQVFVAQRKAKKK